MKYVKEAYYSLKLLFKNPKILLPDGLWVIGIFITNMLFIQFSGILNIIHLEDMLNQLVTGDWVKLLVALCVLIFTQFFWGVGIETFRFLMARDITQGKKTSLLGAWKLKRSYFFKLVLLKVLTYCLMVIVLLPVIALGIMAKNSMILAILSVALILLVALLLRLALLFRNAFLFLGLKKPLIALEESIMMLRKKLLYTLIIWVVLTAVFLVVALFNYVLGSLLYYFRPDVYIITALATIIGLLIERLYRVWESLYIFRNFKV